MAIRRRRFARRLLLVTLLVLLVPYGYSRVASLWSRISLRQQETLTAGSSVEPDGALRIATFNIAHGRGTAIDNWSGGDRADRSRRLTRIAKFLRDSHADIVVLNECDFDCSWSHHVNQAEILAKEAGFAYWVEQRNIDFRLMVGSWRFGNAILSKFPIRDADVVELPGYAAWETMLAGKKRAVVCEIQVAPDRVVRVLGTHLSHRSEEVRVASARAINRLAAARETPLVIAGDLNSSPGGFPGSQAGLAGETAIEVILNGGSLQRWPTSLPNKADMTFPSTEPAQVIDWILVPSAWKVISYGVLATDLSDHLPVVMTVDWHDTAVPRESR